MSKIFRFNRQFSILDETTNAIEISSPFKKIDKTHTTNLDEYISILSGSYKEYDLTDKEMCYWEPEASTKVTITDEQTPSGSVIFYSDSLSCVGSELSTIRFEPSGSDDINLRVIILQ